MEDNNPTTITYFSDSLVKDIEVPLRFTFPFNYEPHPLTKIAATALQGYLETQTDLEHNFGLTQDREGQAIGKMFGVLVVKDKDGALGYLSAFSGKLGGSNHHPEFVPPVFDMLVENSFFLKQIEVINAINRQIKEIEAGDNYQVLKHDLERSQALSTLEIVDFKQQLKINKGNRKKRREEQGIVLSDDDRSAFEANLIKQSLYDKHRLNVLLNKWELVLGEKITGIEHFEVQLTTLKSGRKRKSAALQTQLFEHYEFLNKYGDKKNLQSIFNDTTEGKPPAAAGECATPKLLQHAFLNGYEPIAMAEFWWGISPGSEVRKHKQFYPACTEKCKPILKHMLEGMTLDEDPLVKNQ
ncbi:hypothetical protein CJD36_008840 [Flavipsychrobacter stenotrophus]|uniref:Pseudouridylate synthase n=1 Tax=Flavipsychrobacter stenotrophus TaxID=2077091 RepID=A0A2S7SZ59_9BACT|nr:hypothetical protein [Flavipsychrobacter stenotrophus]PQJ11891.1 hypothetical protein CJD36_008840 [Flavipsychrobacter stenotrophus]